jgi:hypothetical protein
LLLFEVFEKMKELFGGTGNVKEKANVFGCGIKKSEGSTNIFAAFNAENPPIFGSGNIFGSTPTTTQFSRRHCTQRQQATKQTSQQLHSEAVCSATNKFLVQ